MRSINLLLGTLLLLALSMLPAGCGGGGGGGGGPSTPTLSSIAVTPANATITAGSSQQFTATGTFSDGSTQNLTNLVTWSSSSGAVPIDSSTGLATTSSTSTGGTVTITAQSGSITGTTLLTISSGSVAGANVMAITVNGSLCNDQTSGGYFNKPCVSVTVCNPNGSACQTVNDILLDTGSYGLRIFKSEISGLSLTQATSSSGGALAECIQFADGSTIWGPVQNALVKLANEPAITIPIHVIDAGFATPTSCNSPDPNPVTAGYAGILGVGPLAQDCGSSCANSAQAGVYFSCVGSNCTGTIVPIANQVPNPVASLSSADRNGILVQLPALPAGGAPSVNGSLFLGIGTQANNTPASPVVLPTDQQGDFRTLFGGNNSIGFLDTGSNALFFPNATGIPLCSDPNWYCPPTTLSLSASLIGSTGSPTKTVPFNVGNFDSLFSASSNNVFSEIGGPSNFGFDWGLPFFLGRNVFIGISGRTAPGLGTGPYVAF
jgi:hypothetical protein